MNAPFTAWQPFEPMEDDPVSKAGKGSKYGLIKGVASTEKVDADGEIIAQDGLDWSWFEGNGFITYEHPMSVGNIVGEPRRIIKSEVGGFAATSIEGVLYLTDPAARGIWGKACAIKKSGSDRRLGFSIEGAVVSREGSRVTKAKVTSVAISAQPKNSLTWWEPLMRSLLARSFSGAGYPTPQGGAGFSGDFAPIVPQSLQGGNPSSAAEAVWDDDALISRLLKQMPQLTWAQGLSIVTALKHQRSQ